jgi:hypothetical protein
MCLLLPSHCLCTVFVHGSTPWQPEASTVFIRRGSRADLMSLYESSFQNDVDLAANGSLDQVIGPQLMSLMEHVLKL